MGTIPTGRTLCLMFGHVFRSGHAFCYHILCMFARLKCCFSACATPRRVIPGVLAPYAPTDTRSRQWKSSGVLFFRGGTCCGLPLTFSRIPAHMWTFDSSLTLELPCAEKSRVLVFVLCGYWCLVSSVRSNLKLLG